MKKLLICLMCIIFSTSALTSCRKNEPTPTPDEEKALATIDLTLLSFNIRTLMEESNPVNEWENRKHAVIPYLSDQNASVICLQEVKQTQYEDIRASIADKYEIIYYGREITTNPEGLAILYDKTVWNKVSEDMFWLSETPQRPSKDWGASHYRICVNILLKHNETGAKLNVFNVHLDVKSAEARKNGLSLVLEKTASSAYPVFLAGDFNSKIGSEPLSLASAALQNCQTTAPLTDNGVTHHGWGAKADDSGTAIDFCFVDKAWMSPLSFQICRDRWGENSENYFSDHYAVKIQVRLAYETSLPNITDEGFDGALDLIN